MQVTLNVNLNVAPESPEQPPVNAVAFDSDQFAGGPAYRIDDSPLLWATRYFGGIYEAEIAERFPDDANWRDRADRLVSLGLARWLPGKLGRYLVPKWVPQCSQSA
jgi:hypothetical protein